MNYHQVHVRTGCGLLSRFQVFTIRMYWISRIVVSNVRTSIDVIFICSFYVVNFNVSSTKLMHMLSILDTLSMGITFGIRAGQFRSCHGSLDFN